MSLALEAAVVGAVLAAVLALTALFAPAALAGPARAAATGLVLGALVHLGFEAAGLNRAYCTAGHACRRG
jgi:hypothetical protein